MALKHADDYIRLDCSYALEQFSFNTISTYNFGQNDNLLHRQVMVRFIEKD